MHVADHGVAEADSTEVDLEVEEEVVAVALVDLVADHLGEEEQEAGGKNVCVITANREISARVTEV